MKVVTPRGVAAGGRGKIKMPLKESFERWVMDGRTLLAILLLALLWRYASHQPAIAPWESSISGSALIIFGWLIFAYLYRTSRKETSWLVSNKMFQGLAVSLAAINIYVLVYYGMTWSGLLHVELGVPYDRLLYDVRYMMLVLCYCGLIWAARYLKKMHDNYLLLTEEVPAMRKGAIRAAMFRILTDERTAIVIIAIAFFWRAFVSLDRAIILWESMVSGVALIILGWVLLGYMSSLARRVISRPNMVKIYHGIAVALLAINLYVLVYYGMRWYRLLLVGEEILQPLDFVFRDIRYFVFVIFYATALALSKWLEKAAVECEFLTKKEEVEK
jgi:hypothetical protein